MNSNTGFKKVFHKSKSEVSQERSKTKGKEPQWKQERQRQQKRNWNLGD